MREYLQSMTDVLIDRSIEELVGAMMIALVLALVLAGFYALARRKMNDSPMLMIGLLLFASIMSMALAAGYIANDRQAFMPVPGSPPSTARRPPSGFHAGPGGAPGRSPGLRIVMAADADNDGRLSPEEAAQFVLTADSSGRGSVDPRDLDNAFMKGRPEPPRPQ